MRSVLFAALSVLALAAAVAGVYFLAGLGWALVAGAVAGYVARYELLG